MREATIASEPEFEVDHDDDQDEEDGSQADERGERPQVQHHLHGERPQPQDGERPFQLRAINGRETTSATLGVTFFSYVESDLEKPFQLLKNAWSATVDTVPKPPAWATVWYHTVSYMMRSRGNKEDTIRASIVGNLCLCKYHGPSMRLFDVDVIWLKGRYRFDHSFLSGGDSSNKLCSATFARQYVWQMRKEREEEAKNPGPQGETQEEMDKAFAKTEQDWRFDNEMGFVIAESINATSFSTNLEQMRGRKAHIIMFQEHAMTEEQTHAVNLSLAADVWDMQAGPRDPAHDRNTGGVGSQCIKLPLIHI